MQQQANDGMHSTWWELLTLCARADGDIRRTEKLYGPQVSAITREDVISIDVDKCVAHLTKIQTELLSPCASRVSCPPRVKYMLDV